MKFWPLVEAALTPKCREVCVLLLKGKNTPEIARTLHMNENTIKHHLSNMYRKFEIDTQCKHAHIILAVLLTRYVIHSRVN